MVVVDVGQINYRSELPRRILDGVKAFGQMLPDVLQAADVQRLEAVIDHVLVRRIRVRASPARHALEARVTSTYVGAGRAPEAGSRVRGGVDDLCAIPFYGRPTPSTR